MNSGTFYLFTFNDLHRIRMIFEQLSAGGDASQYARRSSVGERNFVSSKPKHVSKTCGPDFQDLLEADNEEQTCVNELYEILDRNYKTIMTQLIQYQSPTTGMFPIFSNDKSCANVGHVRDTIYCAIAIWSLRQCYSKIDMDKGRTYHLGQVAVKAMRGILFCWMKQTDKLERFKTNQIPENSLHSRFNIVSGEEMFDLNYGHLQIDCVAFYLITLSQMITSGLQVNKINF
jgi:hypothetical protein